METKISTLVPLAIAAALALGGLVLGLVARRSWLPVLGQRLGLGQGVVEALRGPVLLWCVMLGLYLAARLSLLPGAASAIVRQLLVVLLIMSVAWSLGGAIALALHHRTAAIDGAPQSVRLVGNLVRAIVIGLGALVAMQSIGISITPLLTALGVGGLAVGLALQDTLANLFAGIHILASGQVRPGDFVRLESGEQGFVQDITWRYTTVRQPGNNVTIVPNAKLASAIITNYQLPDPEVAMAVPVSVGDASDLTKVEAVTTAVAKEVMTDVEGAVPTFEPSVRFTAFTDGAISFTVNLRARQFSDQDLIRHELIKRLQVRYQAEDIETPKRTVYSVPVSLPARSRARK
jgi:small-conductance mechanosensitive channel